MENLVDFKRGMLAKVNPFLNKFPAYSYIYNSQMASLDIDTTPPKYGVVKRNGREENIIFGRYTTAAVCFTNNGKNIRFYFNKFFAEKLTEEEIQFVFAHEALHVLLNHGKKGDEFLKSLPEEQRSHSILNKAMDICINEILIETAFKDRFKYMYNLNDTLCTIRTIFERRGIAVNRDENFKYYYMKILENIKDDENDDDFTMFGDIQESYGGLPQESKENADEMSKGGGVDDDNVKEKMTGGGFKESSGSEKFKEVVTQFKKMSLEDAITRYIKPRNMAMVDFTIAPKVKYEWHKTNRRFAMAKSKDTTVPNRSVKYTHKKMNVVVYCDVSGSVEAYTKRFLSIIDMIDNERVNVIPYVWADSVSEAVKIADDKFSWKACGGGTNIASVISHYTKNYSDDKIDSVVVLTDGEYRDISNMKLGRRFNHQKWVFLMTGSSQLSNVFDKSVSVEIDWRGNTK